MLKKENEYLKISIHLGKRKKLKWIYYLRINTRFSKKMKSLFSSVTDKGYGKRSSAYEYRKTNRGGVGIANMQLSDRNGS